MGAVRHFDCYMCSTLWVSTSTSLGNYCFIMGCGHICAKFVTTSLYQELLGCSSARPFGPCAPLQPSGMEVQIICGVKGMVLNNLNSAIVITYHARVGNVLILSQRSSQDLQVF